MRLYRRASRDGNPRQLTSEAPATPYGLEHLLERNVLRLELLQLGQRGSGGRVPAPPIELDRVIDGVAETAIVVAPGVAGDRVELLAQPPSDPVVVLEAVADMEEGELRDAGSHVWDDDADIATSGSPSNAPRATPPAALHRSHSAI